MKAIMVMYDSLCRRALSPYGCKEIPTPNFDRLAAHSVTFDTDYVCSMPCMPARRELHTGRPNFEHRSWGPIEPYDDSMPEILKNNGIYTHLSTDHYHYWEDGGATYHNRYTTYDFSRGQEGDHWKTNAALMQAVHEKQTVSRTNYWDQANREYMDCEEKMPQAVTFHAGLDFMEQHHDQDNWFLQIETFDPHEPFFTQPEWKKAFAHEYDGGIGDWPPYYYVTEGEDAVDHVRREYAALITMCDYYLGQVLDRMDQYDLWKDTMLIVNTDHGYLLGEHGWWSKSIMPLYEEISHIPLFIHDPRFPEMDGQRRSELTQTIDLAPTVLEFFGQDIPRDMLGKPLRTVIEKDEPVRQYAIFGFQDGHCNVTDGRWVYMKAPVNQQPFYDYTLMPTHMKNRFSVNELKDTELTGPFSFTKGCKVLKVKAQPGMNDPANFGTKLFDLESDPRQEKPLVNPEKETELSNAMMKLMHEDDCPVERFARFGFPVEGAICEEQIKALREMESSDRIPERLNDLNWDRGAGNMYTVVCRFLGEEKTKEIEPALRAMAADDQVTVQIMQQWIGSQVPQAQLPMIWYFGMLASRTE